MRPHAKENPGDAADPESYAEYPLMLSAHQMAQTDNVILGPLAEQLYGKSMIQPEIINRKRKPLTPITQRQNYDYLRPQALPQRQPTPPFRASIGTPPIQR